MCPVSAACERRGATRSYRWGDQGCCPEAKRRFWDKLMDGTHFVNGNCMCVWRGGLIHTRTTTSRGEALTLPSGGDKDNIHPKKPQLLTEPLPQSNSNDRGSNVIVLLPHTTILIGVTVPHSAVTAEKNQYAQLYKLRTLASSLSPPPPRLASPPLTTLWSKQSSSSETELLNCDANEHICWQRLTSSNKAASKFKASAVLVRRLSKWMMLLQRKVTCRREQWGDKSQCRFRERTSAPWMWFRVLINVLEKLPNLERWTLYHLGWKTLDSLLLFNHKRTLRLEIQLYLGNSLTWIST